MACSYPAAFASASLIFRCADSRRPAIRFRRSRSTARIGLKKTLFKKTYRIVTYRTVMKIESGSRLIIRQLSECLRDGPGLSIQTWESSIRIDRLSSEEAAFGIGGA